MAEGIRRGSGYERIAFSAYFVWLSVLAVDVAQAGERTP